MGPTGTGKTVIAKTLAEFLFVKSDGGRVDVIFIDPDAPTAAIEEAMAPAPRPEARQVRSWCWRRAGRGRSSSMLGLQPRSVISTAR